MSFFSGIAHFILTTYVVGFSLFSNLFYEEIFYPWFFFLFEISVCIFQSVLLYNQLDYLFPQIIFDDEDYKKIKITRTQKVIRGVIFVFLILIICFLIFSSVLYAINFSNITGIYYLQIIQTSLSYFVVLFFLNIAFDDFSGRAYCEFYQSQNSREIKFHFIPMTLTKEMREIYDNEFYISEI